MSSDEHPTPARTLSRALRLIRLHRGMRTVDVADAMNMKLRTYENFEAARGTLNIERIHEFAKVTDSDPYAIFAAMDIGSPAFALRCADNKLMTIMMVEVQEFDLELGDTIAEIDARPLINAFTRTFRDLALQAVKHDRAAAEWLRSRRERLVSRLRRKKD